MQMGCFKQALVTIVASQCLLHCDDDLMEYITVHTAKLTSWLVWSPQLQLLIITLKYNNTHNCKDNKCLAIVTSTT